MDAIIPAANIYSTADELSQFFQMLLNKGTLNGTQIFDPLTVRRATMEAGKMANREVGKPSISEVTLTKEADNSVAALFKEAVSGSAGKKATLKFVRTGTDKVEEFMEYALHDCLVSGYSISADGDEEPMENVSLSFSKCEINYKDHDATNKTGNPQRAGYDLAKAAPL